MKRVLFVCVFMFCSTVGAFAQNALYFGHIVNGARGGGYWKTAIFLTNPAAPGGATASGSITLLQDAGDDPAVLPNAGSPMVAFFVDQNNQPVGNGNVIPFQIPPGETRKYVSTGLPAFAQGFASLSSNAPVGGTLIFSLFADPGYTQLVAEGSVPSAAAVARQTVFVDVKSFTGGNTGFDVGLAYANPGATGVNVTLNLLNSSAQTVLTTTHVLGAGNHRAGFVYQMFNQPSLPEMVGTLQITSNNGALSATALRFAIPSYIFTTIAPVNIASMLFEPLNALQRLAATLLRTLPSFSA